MLLYVLKKKQVKTKSPESSKQGEFMVLEVRRRIDVSITLSNEGGKPPFFFQRILGILPFAMAYVAWYTTVKTWCELRLYNIWGRWALVQYLGSR